MIGQVRIHCRHGLRLLYDSRVISLLLLLVSVMCAQVRIRLPFTEVPLTGQTFAVLLTGMLVGSRWGPATQGLYVALGAAGLPIYAGGSGGFAALAGPTGGYLVGFVLAAFVVGILARLRPCSFLWLCLCGAVGSLVIYALGAAWYSLVMAQPPYATFVQGVLPFLPGDGAKLILAASIAAGFHRLRKELQPLGDDASRRSD